MTYRNFYLDATNLADKIRSGEYKQVQDTRMGEAQNALVRRPKKEVVQESQPKGYRDLTAEYLRLASFSLEDVPAEVAARVDSYGEGSTSYTPSFKTDSKMYSGYEGLTDLIDTHEGGGDYNTLFGFSNKDTFSGINVSEMTIGDLKAFANGPYGQWSKEQLGYKATPMGRYQIVGNTLNETAKAMGLSDDAVFNKETQDSMFAYLADNAIRRGGIEGLRNEWEGFKNIPDGVLKEAADRFTSSSSVRPKPKPKPFSPREGK